MPDLGVAQEEIGLKRTRRRLESFKFDRDQVAARIQRFYDDDTAARADDGYVDARIQRYAKYRMWRDPNVSGDEADVALADLATHSLRIQDTLHNAVMTMRPCISAVPNAVKQDEEKARDIDALLDYQMFSENRGEVLIGNAAEAFVNDNCLTIYVPWVKEERDIVEIKRYPAIPPEELPGTYFKGLLMAEYPNQDLYKRDEEGWEWEVDQNGKITRISCFTTEEGEAELVVRKPVTVFDGPCPQVLDWEDVIYPARCENLQPPGPSNPKGAPHVIIKSYPQLDEIRRLQKTGFYNLLTDQELADLENLTGTPTTEAENQDQKIQKDKLAGETPAVETIDSHRPLTRFMVFDRFDVDGDGLDEDVIWWYLEEPALVIRACYLTEMFPADPPRRPFAESSFIPVAGRRDGISLLELLESTHDFMKQMTDQVVDAGNFANFPFGFFRAASSLKQERMRLEPRTLYPLADPTNDIYFPNLPGQSQTFGLNMLTLKGQEQDKLAMQSDLQFGRVPAGQASALRTTGSQQTLLAQGEARPERILRRFFLCLTEVWAQAHELNQRFLPAKKQFRIAGYRTPDENPYHEIASREAIAGRFQFTFKANVLNTSKQALQQALSQIISMYLNPLAIQAGHVGAPEIGNLLRDFATALGQDAESKGYIRPVPPEMKGPPISFEMAITSILNLQEPHGPPIEGFMGHLQKLIQFIESDEMAKVGDPAMQKLLAAYVQKIGLYAQQEVQQQQLAAAAAQGQGGGGPGGTPAGPADTSNQQLAPNELLNEQLPGAKGGNA